MTSFIGRKAELALLYGLLEKTTSSLVVVSGRRRIGKSRLIKEFGKKFSKVCIFSGIPPTTMTTAQGQRDAFGAQLRTMFKEKVAQADAWDDYFLHLAKHISKGKVLVVFDEISWMGSKDDSFLGKLKNAWDLKFKDNPNVVVVLCGSVSTWIEKNIISSTGFLGRISLHVRVGELLLSDCSKFWRGLSKKITAYEKFKVLAVTGGVPKYLEEIKPYKSAEENIRQLCFQKSGILFNEFEHIFSDLFSSRSTLYKDIVACLMDGFSTYDEVYERLRVEKSGTITEYLNDLVQAGFVQRDYTWNLKTGARGKLSTFRVSDNYVRFYLKYIKPQHDRIERGAFDDASLTLLPGWESVMGLQFENLVLSNRRSLHQLLGIKPEEIVNANPFFQKKTTRQAGCQIDYLIQTRFNTLYVCEIKFHRRPIGLEIIQEVERKITSLAGARSFSIRPVLISVNGVLDDVLEANYFAHCIDFGQLLEC